MENPLTKSDAALVQRANADEIEEMTAVVIETSRELDRANNALTMLNEAVDTFTQRKQVYEQKTSNVRRKMQKLASEM